jgi:hypothetical protein
VPLSRVLILLATFLLTAAAHAAEPIALHVRIEPTEAGVTAHFVLDRPVTSFELSYDSADIRDRTWKITTPAIKREGTRITAGGGPFDKFSVDIDAYNEPTNATYPNVFRAGTGIVFYAGYFVGVEPAFATTIEVAPRNGDVVEGLPLPGNVWRVDPAFHRNAAHRYVYVGPDSGISESRYARFVMPDGPAPALIARIRANVDGAVGYYTRKLERPLATKPLIILAANPDSERNGMQGDTTMGPTVGLRLFGKRWSTFDQKSDAFDHFIAHEASHFWNADTYHANQNAPAWIWEGSAEFWALNARVDVMKRLTRKGSSDHIEAALNACVDDLRERPLTGHRSTTTYVCGETLYWLADVAMKRTKKGEDIFSLWRQILRKADANGGIYTAGDIFTLAAPTDTAKNAFALFLAETGGDRWHKLPALLKPLAVDLKSGPPTDETLRRAPIIHLLNLYCEGTRGMWSEERHMKLDTGDRCGPLSGDPEVDSLNGINLYTDTKAAFDSAMAACAANGDLTLTRTGNPTKVVAACKAPLAMPPPNFRIASTP